jgi:hypothetical protein
MYINQRMHLVTVLILVLDFTWLFAWIAVVAWAIENGDSVHSTAAFTALASPHISVIPALMTVAVSFRRAIAKNKEGKASLASFDFGWLLSPALAVPFDAALARLTYRANSNDILSWGIATYGICTSMTAAAFMAVVYYEISDILGRKARDPLTEGVGYFVKGFRPCVWQPHHKEVKDLTQRELENSQKLHLKLRGPL